MKTFIWKYNHLSFVCNTGTIEAAKESFIGARDSSIGKDGIYPNEMALLTNVVDNEEPIVLEDGLCAILTRTKY